MNSPQKVDQGEGALVEALAAGLTECLRVAHFSRVEEWLDELRKQQPALALPYIRLTGLYRIDPQFQVIEHVILLAGFYGEAEYVELRCYCGQAVAGDDGRARGQYDRQAMVIRDACKELGIEVRAGSWSPIRREA